MAVQTSQVHVGLPETGEKSDGGCSYEKFHHYDFYTDVKFQSGWSKIIPAISEERKEAEFLKAKLFYYSRLYSKVTKEGYQQWLQEQTRETDKNLIGGTKYPEIKTVDAEKSSNPTEHEMSSVDALTNESEEISQVTASSTNGIVASTKTGDYDQQDLTASTTLTDDDTRQTVTVHTRDTTQKNNKTELDESEDLQNCLNSDHDHTSVELEFSKIAEMIEKGLKLPGLEELNIKPSEVEPSPAAMERVKKPWEC